MKSTIAIKFILITSLFWVFSQWRVQADERFSIRTRLQTPLPSYVEWNPDGSKLIIVSIPNILIWDETSQKLETFVSDAQVNRVTWSPDGSKLAAVTGGDDEILRIWDIETRRLILKKNYVGPSQAYAYGAVWSPNGAMIASDSTNQGVLIWNVALLTDVSVYPLDANHKIGRVGIPVWSKDSKYVAIDDTDNAVNIWDVEFRQKKHTLEGLSFLDWNPNSDLLVGSRDEGTVLVWNSLNNTLSQSYKFGTSPVLVSKWDRGGKFIASGDIEGQFKIWDYAQSSFIFSTKAYTKFVDSIAWNSNEQLIATSSTTDNEVNIWKKK